MTTSDLLKKFYKGGEQPENARIIVTGLVAALVKKTGRGVHEYRVLKSERAGPKPIEVWVEKQKRRA